MRNPNPKPKASLSAEPETEPYTTYTSLSGAGGVGGGMTIAPPPTATLYPTPATTQKMPSLSANAGPIEFFHEFVPPTATAQSRRHLRNGHTHPTDEVKRAAALLRAVMEPHAPVFPLTGPLSVGLLWTWPGSEQPAWKITRPDLDNLAKLALDAMTKTGYWQDDSQVCEFTTAKFTGPIPGLAVTVSEIKKEEC